MGSLESDTTERLHFHFSLSCIGEGNGNPLQSSCLENPRDGGAGWAAVYGVAQSWTWLKRLSSSSSSMICLCLTAKLFSRLAVPFYIPIINYASLAAPGNNKIWIFKKAILIGEWWYCTMVLICISQQLMISIMFPCVHWPSTSFICEVSIQTLCPLFEFSFSYCWVWEFFTHSGVNTYVICKYFLSLCILSFHFLNGVFCRARAFNFNEVQFIFFFFSFVILVISLYSPRSQKCSPIYSFKSCYLDLWSILSYLLYKVWDIH